MTAGDSSGAYPAHAWLAAVVPVDARRFEVADPALARVLRDAGAEIVDRDAAVEIAALDSLRGHAPVAIVTADASAGGALRMVRAAKRLVNSVRVRTKALSARRLLRQRGYPTTFVIAWDVLQPLRLPWLAHDRRAWTLVERMPQRALTIGLRSSRTQTVLEAAAADASSASASPFDLRAPSVRAEVLVIVGTDAILRVVIGPGRRAIDWQINALEALHAAGPPASVGDRVPRVLARGRSGIGDWSLEGRLRGTAPSLPLSDVLVRDCVDFLVDLHSVGASGEGESCAAFADALAQLCAADQADALRRLGQGLDARLVDVPRGFGHADFFPGNLLAENGRLTGVVDWDGAGPGRLPLLGLLHLRLSSEHRPQDDEWGRTIVDRLLPWAEAGGDEIARDYCERLALRIDAERLRAFALAFWLDLVTLHLRLHPFRRDDARWIDHNINFVLRALAHDRLLEWP